MVFAGKSWLSITMLSQMVTSRSIGKIMLRHGSTNPPAKLGDAMLGKQRLLKFSQGLLENFVQVHGQTLKYNMKLKEGRGFSLEELKAAGIPKKLAPTIGIAVDHMRRNRSLEGLQTHVQRLKTFKAKLVVFPRRARKTKAGDSTPEELATATQVQGPLLPILRERPAVELVKVTEEMKSFNAYAKLRVERTNNWVQS
ncbi:hypothetical protein L1987_55951 [Smallanthus sonchifolius]|uniref:Uncharacterized protein n=1 Tax=Smallanthus sonchifolius TaxID=185202 RepID=A0ACB9EBD8_9ASTR|nr:hypothetical protein L1987_55951 [Smallanthus sonchifolius]